ncbi:MAG TPA: S41 family peptidase [Anaerolineae bacterium]
MSKSFKAIVLSVSLGLVLFSVIGSLGVYAANNNNDSAYRQLGVYSEVLSRIRNEYVEEPSINHVTDGALHGLLESLDANSSYLTPDEYKDYKAHQAGGKADIGAAVSKRFGYAAVIAVLPNSPADKAGMDSGDIIESIEGRGTHDLSLAAIQSLLSGPAGSTVKMEVVRARRAQPQKLALTREVVAMPPATDKVVEEGVGYIQVEAFNQGKSQEIASKIKDLEKQGGKKFVLDLRNCADGDENEGIATANLFLDHGIITYLQGQKYPKQTFNANAAKRVTDLPLVVLVNRGTAGAAEIVAAAILENARGDVLGDKTFGVGSVQKTIDLPDGSALILSVAKYYSPNGKAIQDTAVTPNILLAQKDEDLPLPDDSDNPAPEPDKKKDKGPDDQLRRAIEILKNPTQKASIGSEAPATK